ncbi:MAG TPA: trigger factor [Actinomycetes bacterium]|nr:trigger factor [Actinomycetes bacterium]
MRTSVESVEPTRVKINVVVEPDELRPAIDRTVRRLASEVRVPGFRKGRVPRQVMEARLGRAAIVADAIENEAVPEFYARALAELEIRPLSRAQVDTPSYEDGGPLEFSATVEIKPDLKLPPYKGVKVEAPDAEVGDEDVDQQLERLRERVAQLEVIGRPLAPGDYAQIDVRTTRHSEEVGALTRNDLLYELGSGQVVPELDKELEGKRKGDILKLNVTLGEQAGELAGQDVTMQVLVKETKAKVLPALDDDFASEASEFDTLEELRASVREQLQALATQQAAAELETRVLSAYLDTLTVPLPETLVNDELRYRAARVSERLAMAGTTIDAYLEMTGTTMEQFQADLEAQAGRAVQVQLVLDAVVEAEGLEVTDADVDAEIRQQAQRLGHDPEEVRRVFAGGREDVIRGDILRSKALALMVQHADTSGGGGRARSKPSAPRPPAPAAGAPAPPEADTPARTQVEE